MKTITSTKTGQSFGLMRGIVTRNILYMPKPDCPNLTDKNGVTVTSNNKWDVQVWIPSLQSGQPKPNDFLPDYNMIGTEDDYGEYMWASVSGPIFKDQIGVEGSEFPDVWSSMFYGKYMQDVPSTYPGIGDVVFILFEEGNLARPVVIGSLLCDGNAVKYRTTGYSGKHTEVNLASRIEGRTISSNDEYI